MSAEVNYKCIVGELASATTVESLKGAFSRYGKIIRSEIIHRVHHETGVPMRFGIVTFSNGDDMRKAIKGMNDQNLDGRVITVREDKEDRPRVRGGGGGGFRYGFRDRHVRDRLCWGWSFCGDHRDR